MRRWGQDEKYAEGVGAQTGFSPRVLLPTSFLGSSIRYVFSFRGIFLDSGGGGPSYMRRRGGGLGGEKPLPCNMCTLLSFVSLPHIYFAKLHRTQYVETG